MERTTALKKLRKLLGKKVAYRVDPKASNAEQREAAKRLLPAALERKKTSANAREARAQAVLAADTEYQALKAEWNEANERVSELHAIIYSEKINVGVITDMGFFHVKAHGDSWEDVIAKLKPRGD